MSSAAITSLPPAPVNIAAGQSGNDFDSLLPRVASQAEVHLQNHQNRLPLEYVIRETFEGKDITFMRAVRNQQCDLVRTILQRDPKLLLINTLECATFEAARAGCTPIVRDLIRTGMIPPGFIGHSLQIAAQQGRAEIVSLCLSENPPIQYVAAALFSAAENGHMACLRPIVDSRTNFDSRELGRALYLSIKNGHLGCVTFLAQRPMPHQQAARALVTAAENGRTECAMALLKHQGFHVSERYAYSDFTDHLVPLFPDAIKSATVLGHAKCAQALRDWVRSKTPPTCIVS